MKTRLMTYGAVPAMMMSMHLTALAQVTANPQADFVPIHASVTNLPPSTYVYLVQKAYTLRQNEMRRVFGRVEITGKTGTTHGSGSNPDYASGDVECSGPNSFVQEGTAGQNYEGPNKAAGPDYPTTGHLVLYPEVLIQAPTAGTYVCDLFASTAKAETVVGRSFQGDNTTWLRVSAPSGTYTALHKATRRSVSHRIAADNPSSADAFMWGAPPGCGEQGDGACLFLGKGALPSVDVFSPEAVWSPATDAAFVDVNASLQVTLCGKTSSCSKSEHQSNDETSVVVDSYLKLIQLNAAGAACRTTTSPTQRSTITNAPHHYMIYHRLSTVPVYPACGTPQFVVKLLVNWVSGSTAKVDGPSSTPGLTGATHAIAFTSYHGAARPVPNVVGLNESAANTILAASGYAPGVLSKVVSTAAKDTVLSQDPPGSPSIIELPGSTVNLTLSTGRVAVPNVVSLAQNKATGEIAAVGLVPNVIVQPGCVDPGIVSRQSPVAGAGVAPGSAVALIIDSGKTSRGAPCGPNK